MLVVAGVEATLPFFIPAPPLFIAGTFGAFIKIKSPIPSRRALFDIGLAGPLAGFAALLPVSVLAIVLLRPGSALGDHFLIFNDPLLFRLLARAFHVRLDTAVPNPFYSAAWIGLLVTSLNLMPVGQLDGGHGTFAVFGPQHTSGLVVSPFSDGLTSTLGWFWHGSPSGFLYRVTGHHAECTSSPTLAKIGVAGWRANGAILTLMVSRSPSLPALRCDYLGGWQ